MVEATALSKILSSLEYKANFTLLAKTCDSVICCRVSPKQKADVVSLIKHDNSKVITAAIGDGANDVSMIREAHIGIGLYGNEGLRAVQSSDFALSEFRLLWRLLLVHGRKAYRNNAEMILYFFYKNLVMTFPHYFYAFYCSFSGISLFDDYYISYYNLLFTAWPLAWRGLFEFDVNVEMDGPLIEYLIPNLYYLGQTN
jgi:magnesium-transporting ATPase (P-type)